MKQFYLMSRLRHTLRYGHYVIIIRARGIHTQHEPDSSTARKLLVQDKQLAGIIHSIFLVKGAAPPNGKAFRSWFHYRPTSRPLLVANVIKRNYLCNRIRRRGIRVRDDNLFKTT